jgi:glutamate/tyrosine decarboxylase-like PLP-dependent enzyme
VDGAFGLWLRTLPEKANLTRCIEDADSWAVDGHKWLQIPYDSGFAIVRDPSAHRRAMDISAAYLNSAPFDGRNPTEYNPELSRRARGFTVWAMLQSLGREGVREIVGRHCRYAVEVADQLSRIPGVEVLNRIDANQIVFRWNGNDHVQKEAATDQLANSINQTGRLFVRPTVWKETPCLRLSIISGETQASDVRDLCAEIERALSETRASSSDEPLAN